jgi:ribosomal protein S18 acetylase RimI-like enzyme
MVNMQLTPLSSQTEPLFWQITRQDPLNYYFFIHDWQNHKDKTQIYLAQTPHAVAGLMLVFEGSIAQLRGTVEAVQFLLGNLSATVQDVQVPLNCEKLLLERFPHYQLKAHVFLMALERGKEHLHFGVAPEQLSARDAGAVAGLMHLCCPQLWSGVSAEMVAARMESAEAVWVGIKAAGELVAFGYALLMPAVSQVTWIATHPRHENRGYATAVTSALVQRCLRTSPTAIIYVMDDNVRAQGIYGKVGFRPVRSYCFIKQTS